MNFNDAKTQIPVFETCLLKLTFATTRSHFLVGGVFLFPKLAIVFPPEFDLLP